MLVVILILFFICSCASVNEHNNYGFNPGPGMCEDAQDFSDTKYNFLDSPDGMQDPNAKIKVWKAEF